MLRNRYPQHDDSADASERPLSNRLRGQRKQTQPKHLVKRETKIVGDQSSATEPPTASQVLRADAREFIHSSQLNAGALGLRADAREFVPSFQR